MERLAYIDKTKLVWKISCHCGNTFNRTKSPAKCAKCGQWYIMPNKKALQNLKKDQISQKE